MLYCGTSVGRLLAAIPTKCCLMLVDEPIFMKRIPKLTTYSLCVLGRQSCDQPKSCWCGRTFGRITS